MAQRAEAELGDFGRTCTMLACATKPVLGGIRQQKKESMNLQLDKRLATDDAGPEGKITVGTRCAPWESADEENTSSNQSGTRV